MCYLSTFWKVTFYIHLPNVIKAHCLPKNDRSFPERSSFFLPQLFIAFYFPRNSLNLRQKSIRKPDMKILIATFFLITSIYAGNTKQKEMKIVEFPETVKALPNFTLQDLDGERVNSKDFLGKITVLDFWATWCKSCKKAIPTLNRLSDKYADKINVIGINTDYKGVNKAMKYVIKYNIGYQTLISPSTRLSEELDIESLPMILVFDKKGKFVKRIKGFEKDDKQEFLATVNSLLKK